MMNCRKLKVVLINCLILTPVSIHCDSMNNEFNQVTYNHLLFETQFHKLSWKHKYEDKDTNGEITFYGKIMQ